MKIIVISTADRIRHPAPNRLNFIFDALAEEHEVYVLHFQLKRFLDLAPRERKWSRVEAGGIESGGPSSYYLMNSMAHFLKIRDTVKGYGINDIFAAIATFDINMHITLANGGLYSSFLEASPMGKPIIATPVCGIPEAREDGNNGLLTEQDIDAISKKIVYMLQNKKRGEKIDRSTKKTAEEKFTWKIAVYNILKISTGIVSSSEDCS